MTTDQEIIQQWLKGKSEATQRSYLYVFEKLSNFCAKSLAEITTNDLHRYQWSLTGVGDNTVKLHVNAIKSLFRFCKKTGHISVNHAELLDAPKVQARFDDRMLTEQEVSAIITHTKRRRDALFIRFLYMTGMRVAEACSIKWRNIIAGPDNCSVTFTGKGDKRRAVHFSLTLWQELQELGNTDPDAPVFRSRKGGHLDPSQAWRIVREAAQAAGIKGNVSPHWFRHSHASHALAKGASLVAVRDTLGHANIGITDRYLHSRPEDSSSFYLQ